MRFQLLLFILLLGSFELLAQNWCQKEDFPKSIRRNTTGFSLLGKGYVCLGGNNTTSTSGHFKDLEMYDPNSDSWTSKTRFPGIARRNGMSFTIDSFAFVGLGWNNSSNFSDIYRYDPIQDTWDTITPYPGQGNRNPIAASVNGKGYVGGGTNSTSNPHQKDFHEYNPDTDTWTQLSDLPFGNRSSAISFSSDSLVYFGLGYDGSSFHDDLWSYNPRTTIWTQLSSYPGNKRFEASCFKLDSNIVIVGGGSTTGSPFSDYYEYDIATDTWSSIIGFSAGGRSRGAYFAIGNNGYISTGNNGAGNLKDTWVFTPDLYLTSYVDSTICFGDSVVLDVTTPNANYLWQDSSTNPTFTILDSGLYWVITSKTNCNTWDSIQVKNYPEIPINLGNDTNICANNSILLDATIPGATYSWQNNATAATFLAQNSGIYWVDVTLNNCTKRDSITISLNPEIIIDLGSDTMICPNSSILLDATAIGASYLWQDNSTNSTFLVKDSGIYWVEVTLNNCIKRDSIVVSLKPEIPIDLGKDTSICPNSSLLLDASISGATYIWQDNSTAATFLAQDSGIYWVDVTLDNCIKRDSIVVEIKQEINNNLGPDTTICLGDSVILSSPTSMATYLWQDGSTNPNFIARSEGIYWLEVTLNGCSKRDSIEVYVLTNSFKGLGNDTILCFGEELTLNKSLSNVFYLWQDSSTNAEFTVTEAGIYWLEISLPNCKKRDSIIVSYEEEIDADLGGDTALCFGDTLNFNLTQTNATYLWSDSSTKATFDIDTEGIYWVEVSLNNCLKRDSIKVSFSAQRKLNLGNDSILCINETLLLDAKFANSTFLWQDGSTNPTYLVNDSGLYWVAVSDLCATLRDSIYISYLDCNCPVNIPNVITPNNDGVNDFFYVSSTCDLEPFRLRIFNRWGVELIEYNSATLRWDARVNGAFVEEGLYFYTLEYKSEFESRTTKKAGSFSIFR